MELEYGQTIQNLLAHLELDPRLVAVERNLDIVPKSQYPNQLLSEGDMIEIVHFVGGG